jgi:hypothetical protein
MTRHSTRLAFAALLAGIALSAPAAPALAQSDTGTSGEGQATASGCAEQIKMLDELVRQSGLDSKAGEKAARELAAKEPLLVVLSDGRIVNLSGEEELSKPLESWLNALDVNRKAVTDLTAAQELLESAKEEDCQKLLQPYKFKVRG